MSADEQQEQAEEFTRGMALHHFRQDDGQTDAHLRACPDAAAENVDAYGSSCGYGTCEMAEVEAEISCPHGHSVRYAYAEYGDLRYLIEEYREALATAGAVRH